MSNASWKIYSRPKEIWNEMLQACEKAETTIDFENFILSPDEIGIKFFEIFIKKAKAGVKIRILCDSAGSVDLSPTSYPESLKDAGVEIEFFNWLTPGTFGNHTIWFYRDHQRLLIIDGKIGFTGSVCIDKSTEKWNELAIKIENSIAVSEMSHSFNVMWLKSRKKKMKFLNGTKLFSKNPDFCYINNTPIPRKRYLHYAILKTIKSAEKEILLTTPYFVPDHRIRRALKNASKRGVSVKIILPEKSDHKLVDLASRSHFDYLLKHGIRIYRYKPSLIHAKTAVIDEKISFVGSFNFDNLSIYYNFEGSLASRDLLFSKEVKKHFEENLKDSEKIDYNFWKKRSLIWKILEKVIIPIRRFL